MIAFTVSDLNEKRAGSVGKRFGAKVSGVSGLATSCDVVLIAVPLGKTAQVIREAAPLMKKGALLIDVCSVKDILKKSFCFAKKFGIEILSLHPLFGPACKSWKHKRIAAIKVKEGAKSRKFLKILRNEGFEVFETTIEEHDKETAVTQAAAALFVSALCKTADKRFSTTNFEKLLEVGKKIEKNGEMYSEIIKNNLHTQKAVKQVIKKALRHEP